MAASANSFSARKEDATVLALFHRLAERLGAALAARLLRLSERFKLNALLVGEAVAAARDRPGDGHDDDENEKEDDAAHTIAAGAENVAALKDFENEAVAEVGDDEDEEAGPEPAQRRFRAPAGKAASRQQNAEEHPGDPREDHLVVKPEEDPVGLFGGEAPEHEDGRHEEEADSDDAKEDALHHNEARH